MYTLKLKSRSAFKYLLAGLLVALCVISSVEGAPTRPGKAVGTPCNVIDFVLKTASFSHRLLNLLPRLPNPLLRLGNPLQRSGRPLPSRPRQRKGILAKPKVGSLPSQLLRNPPRVEPCPVPSAGPRKRRPPLQVNNGSSSELPLPTLPVTSLLSCSTVRRRNTRLALRNRT